MDINKICVWFSKHAKSFKWFNSIPVKPKVRQTTKGFRWFNLIQVELEGSADCKKSFGWTWFEWNEILGQIK